MELMMKRHSRFVVIIAITSLASTILSLAPSMAEGKAKGVKPAAAGRTSTSIPNTILSGTVAPKASVGIDGDFYVDFKSMNFYGPKVSGKWPLPIGLRGPQGATGAPGVMGLDGDDGATGKAGSSSVVVGATGSVGPAGPKGETGAAGVAGGSGAPGMIGAAGATGPAGVAGSQGAQGAAGAAGTSGGQGAQGIQGVQGAPGSKGDAGSNGDAGAKGDTGSIGNTGSKGDAGIAGAKGDTGSIGATGPSTSTYGTITFTAPILGAAGVSQTSNNFGAFEARKSYLVRVILETWNATKLISTYPLSLEVTAIGASPTISVSYNVANGSFWNPTSLAKQDKVGIVADVLIDGTSAATAFELVVTVACGVATNSYAISLAGAYVKTLIGQVG
ncbi:MAG: collagen-like protein [Streptomycetaceae bacterium]|nr:MAG: collagen-like protein [Streptomycetaceae bacterium]